MFPKLIPSRYVLENPAAVDNFLCRGPNGRDANSKSEENMPYSVSGKYTVIHFLFFSQVVMDVTLHMVGCLSDLEKGIFLRCWDECHRITLKCQHWFRWWLGAWWHQAITWANVDPDQCRHIASPGHNVLKHKDSRHPFATPTIALLTLYVLMLYLHTISLLGTITV